MQALGSVDDLGMYPCEEEDAVDDKSEIVEVVIRYADDVPSTTRQYQAASGAHCVAQSVSRVPY